jgi:tetratricopeptide (TPR) repeat protein
VNQLKVMWFLSILLLLSSRSMASNEIEIDTDISNPTPTATPMNSISSPEAVVTATPTTVMPAPTLQVKTEVTVVSAKPVETSVFTPVEVHGVLKMKDVYKAGLSYYHKQDFAKAIRYLKESLQVQDPYTPKYYYAEANAMLGVIYQFHIIDEDVAYSYYKEALAIDPETATARKHIRELSGRKVSK